MARGRFSRILVAVPLLLMAVPVWAQRGRPPVGGGGAPPPPVTGGGASAEQERVEELSLAVGETKSISAKDVRNFSVADQTVIDVRVSPDGSTFLVVGRKSGSTTLVLINNNGSQTTWSINVSSRPPEIVYRELQQLLEGTDRRPHSPGRWPLLRRGRRHDGHRAEAHLAHLRPLPRSGRKPRPGGVGRGR